MNQTQGAILHERDGGGGKFLGPEPPGSEAARARQISVRRVRSWTAQTIRATPTATPIQVSGLEKNP